MSKKKLGLTLILVAMLVAGVFAFSPLSPAHASNSCTNGYIYVGRASSQDIGSFSIVSASLKEKVYNDASGVQHHCKQFHTDATICPTSGNTVGGVGLSYSAWVNQNGVQQGKVVKLTTMGQTSCLIFSSKDTNPGASGTYTGSASDDSSIGGHGTTTPSYTV